MAKSGDVLNMDPLGVRVELPRTAEQTGGELLEFELGPRDLDARATLGEQASHRGGAACSLGTTRRSPTRRWNDAR